MSHLDDAKALVAAHIASSTQVLDLLEQLSAPAPTTTVVDDTSASLTVENADLAAANAALSQQLTASLAQLNDAYARKGVAPAATVSIEAPASSVSPAPALPAVADVAELSAASVSSILTAAQPVL